MDYYRQKHTTKERNRNKLREEDENICYSETV
jgi:hypothetical protein